MYQNILFAVNTSMKNHKVLEEINKLSSENSNVEILNIISEKDMKASKNLGNNIEKVKENRKKDLQHVFDYFENKGITYNMVFGKGTPKDELLKKANSGKYDVIVLSNRKAEEDENIVLGSVSHKVAKRAKIPVLIVK